MIRQRILLILLLAWALAMIVPDVLRVAWPLGAYGFYFDENGLVYDVQGTFDRPEDSPAWKAGLRVGDRVDIAHFDCYPYDAKTCADAVAGVGGRTLVLPGRPATVGLLASERHPAGKVTVVAAPEPANPFERFVLGADQIAGMLVVVAAAWLVWTRPGAMSWGFFLYVMWFNPGRDYAFYAILQPWPIVMLVQTVLTALAEAAGYAGLLLFVMRAPDDEPDPKWRWLERALPAVGCALAILLLAAYSPLVGYRSEIGMWAAVIAGFAIAAVAVFILLERMRRLPPEDYQRLRWVIWGCMIGLPAFLFADLASTTTILDTRFGDFTPADDFIGLLYLVNGILCLFVFQAIRSERVVSVAIPLRRVTILGLTLSVPALLLHHEMDYIQKNLAIPEWAWLVIGGGVLYLITKLHEEATHFTERYFNRNVVALETRLRETILQARSATEIDRLLSEETSRGLALTSAAAFRGKGNIYRRDEAYGWDPGLARVLQRDAPLLAPLAGGKPFAISDEPVEGDPKLPEGIARPVLGVPAANPYRCFSVTLYGPHASGADLDDYERAMLGRLGNSAAAAYAEIETLALEERLAALETVPDHAPPRKRGR